MKVGSKGRYAVVALADVAAHDGAGSVPLGDVSARQSISLSYLEQLFAMMRRSGLVISARGPGGGYRLSRPATEISIGDIFRAVEESPNGGERPDRPGSGLASAMWDDLDAHIQEFLDRMTLKDAMISEKPDAARPPQSNGAVELA